MRSKHFDMNDYRYGKSLLNVRGSIRPSCMPAVFGSELQSVCAGSLRTPSATPAGNKKSTRNQHAVTRNGTDAFNLPMSASTEASVPLGANDKNRQASRMGQQPRGQRQEEQTYNHSQDNITNGRANAKPWMISYSDSSMLPMPCQF